MLRKMAEVSKGATHRGDSPSPVERFARISRNWESHPAPRRKPLLRRQRISFKVLFRKPDLAPSEEQLRNSMRPPSTAFLDRVSRCIEFKLTDAALTGSSADSLVGRNGRRVIVLSFQRISNNLVFLNDVVSIVVETGDGIAVKYPASGRKLILPRAILEELLLIFESRRFG